MRVLIGTTNPSKVRRFEELLSGYGLEFCTLNDLGIDAEPDECGKTPEENAIIKAKQGVYVESVGIMMKTDTLGKTLSIRYCYFFPTSRRISMAGFGNLPR